MIRKGQVHNIEGHDIQAQSSFIADGADLNPPL
jgi:hypothetical protein